MNAQSLEDLQHAVRLTHIWVNDLDQRLKWNDNARSFRLLKAVLHALRDSLQVNEVADLGAKLPILLRGVYYDRWHPAEMPIQAGTVDAFITRVNESFRSDPLADPPTAVMAVLRLLASKIAQGEIADVKRCLPEEVHSIWAQYGKPEGGFPH